MVCAESIVYFWKGLGLNFSFSVPKLWHLENHCFAMLLFRWLESGGMEFYRI